VNYRVDLGLEGKVCVITGAARGIGLCAAFAFAAHGGRLVLLDRDADALADARKQLADAGFDAVVHDLDVTVSSEVDGAAAWVSDEFGGADVLLNSAGIARLHTAVEVTDDEWLKVVDVNLNGMFYACRAFGKSMLQRGTGSVINMGSMSGTIVNRPQFASSYMASKGAVHQLTKALAVEWARSGVRVNALAPGYVGTDMRARPELFETWLDMTPMGRCAEPQEIAAAAVFLASGASSYMTGAIVPVDGGYTAW
jgi:NAD(P)-dependent dehydrogenase (short-subunit alcohol dehydrogenase family)